MFAQVKGTIDFLFGDREWHKFERNRREAAVMLPARSTNQLRPE